MEVLGHAYDYCLVLWDPFRFVSPFPCDLHGRFYSFCSRIHMQYQVEAEEFSDELGKSWEDIVIKRS